jgi:anti-sigma-K factor RskA
VENINDYIESGVLELYVLGNLSDKERLEVESMINLHPTIAAELLEIELAMENVALNLVSVPSIDSKNKFLDAITFVKDVNAATEPKETKVVPINSNNLNFYKYSFAACFALLVVSVAAIVNLSSSINNYKQQVAQLQSSNQDFANQVNFLNKQVELNKQAIGIYSNPDNQLVNLAGTANSPDSKIIIAFNAKVQKVSLDLKSMKMPQTDAEHQYQLWALVDDVPVDLGVFDAEENGVGFKDMKSIGKAQAFAVTLEPKGGNKGPTLNQMVVLGAN